MHSIGIGTYAPTEDPSLHHPVDVLTLIPRVTVRHSHRPGRVWTVRRCELFGFHPYPALCPVCTGSGTCGADCAHQCWRCHGAGHLTTEGD